MNRFYENLSIAVLNPPDLEAEKKQIIVTNSEIEEHRHRYGTLLNRLAVLKSNMRSGLQMRKWEKVRI